MKGIKSFLIIALTVAGCSNAFANPFARFGNIDHSRLRSLIVGSLSTALAIGSCKLAVNCYQDRITAQKEWKAARKSGNFDRARAWDEIQANKAMGIIGATGLSYYFARKGLTRLLSVIKK